MLIYILIKTLKVSQIISIIYLYRLYEIQVKKVIKVQSMIRALLARKRVKTGGKPAAKGNLSIFGLKPPPKVTDVLFNIYMNSDERSGRSCCQNSKR